MVDSLAAATEMLAQAEALVVLAGAGMGVDSGLPSFRGPEGLWRAYPPLRDRGLDFASLAQPRWFDEDPALAWGFYGHRQALYRNTAPHHGYAIIRDWSHRLPCLVITSNVDGHFQRVGFENVWEVHGAIEHQQCQRPCRPQVWPAGAPPAVDPSTLLASPSWPSCPFCGTVARPNILLFHDSAWVSARSAQQEARALAWLQQQQHRRLLALELGAGTAVPTIRNLGYDLRQRGANYLRINPDIPSENEAGLSASFVHLHQGAATALQALDQALLGWH